MTYNKVTHQFDIGNELVHIDSVSEVKVYQWVKSGELSLQDFKSWYAYKAGQAYQSGIDSK